jgi:pilus assembly protein CpaB
MVAEDITTAEVQPGSEPAGCFIDSVAARTSLRGAMVRKSLAVNEPILRDDVLNPGDRGFLAAVLGVGMRAVTVAVDQVSGTAGLIWPGDRVDLVLTQQIDDRDLPAERRVFGETVLSNLRVIAVDQQLMEGAQGGPGGETPPGNVNRTVTIEAGLYDTQRIAVASRLGKISLVVRSAADDQQVSTDQPTTGAMAPVTPPPPIAWAGDVSPALRSHKSTGQSGRTIHLFHGPGTVDVMRY